jgi:hypothetical protein
MNVLLEEISTSAENRLQRAERSYQAVQNAILELKTYILNYTFADKQQEILFFKEIKPQFVSELIYNTEVFYIEAGKPVGSIETQSAYYRQTLDRINTYFERNQFVYVYYRMGKTIYDEQYFVRGAGSDHLLPEYSVDIDPRFSTVYSFKFGKLQAYERLTEYLQQSLFQLEHPDGTSETGKKKYRNLWTDTKAALIEVGYALHARGAVNHGKGDVKQIIAALEYIFNTDTGNFYRTFQSMRIRKKNRTPFLDGCKDSLEKWMDDSDLNFS